MRIVIPPPLPSGDSLDLHRFYAQGWLDGPGVRVNFAASVDGGAELARRPAGPRTLSDQRVSDVLRDLADVVLVGANTAVAEAYVPVRLSPGRVAVRANLGLAETLPIAVTSLALNLDPSASLFVDAPPTARTIVITCAGADVEKRGQLARVADVVICGDSELDLDQARLELADRGLTRVLCEGGPRLFAELSVGHNIDEVCVTVAPILAGPGAGRITAGEPLPDAPHSLELVGLLEEDGALFQRYRVRWS